MDIIQAIKERRSVRSFNGQPLSETIISRLTGIVDQMSSPFSGNVTIRLKRFNITGDYRPSTYGVIKGACDFFLIAMHNDVMSLLSAGYRFEKVILEAWRLGLGSCWISATFKNTVFDRYESWPNGEKLTAICPIGIPSSQRLVERLTRTLLKSKTRKPFSELFFISDFEHSLQPTNRYRESLEMMRLSPSSTNSQPWRALVTGNTVHFYYIPLNPLSPLDCGIGLCHFHEAEKFRGHDGIFISTPDAPTSPKGWKYLMSFQSNS